jgi:hypothetical protein
MPTSRRRRRAALVSSSSLRSCPSRVARPACGRSRPAATCSTVDLPLPLGPVRATTSPAATVSETPRSAGVRAYECATACSSTSGSGAGRSGAGEELIGHPLAGGRQRARVRCRAGPPARRPLRPASAGRRRGGAGRAVARGGRPCPSGRPRPSSCDCSSRIRRRWAARWRSTTSRAGCDDGARSETTVLRTMSSAPVVAGGCRGGEPLVEPGLAGGRDGVDGALGSAVGAGLDDLGQSVAHQAGRGSRRPGRTPAASSRGTRCRAPSSPRSRAAGRRAGAPGALRGGTRPHRTPGVCTWVSSPPSVGGAT